MLHFNSCEHKKVNWDIYNFIHNSYVEVQYGCFNKKSSDLYNNKKILDGLMLFAITRQISDICFLFICCIGG